MSITKKELAEKIRVAWNRADTAEEAWRDAADVAAELLGAELKQERPEPGLHLHYSTPVLVDSDGEVHYLTGYEARHSSVPLDGLSEGHVFIPAVAVPREVPKLTEEQVGELWDETDGTELRWYLVSDPARRRFTACLNAALAKYGRGTTTPSRADVYEAISSAGPHYTFTYQELSDAADAVMALLEGGKA